MFLKQSQNKIAKFSESQPTGLQIQIGQCNCPVVYCWGLIMDTRVFLFCIISARPAILLIAIYYLKDLFWFIGHILHFFLHWRIESKVWAHTVSSVSKYGVSYGLMFASFLLIMIISQLWVAMDMFYYARSHSFLFCVNILRCAVLKKSLSSIWLSISIYLYSDVVHEVV